MDLCMGAKKISMRILISIAFNSYEYQRIVQAMHTILKQMSAAHVFLIKLNPISEGWKSENW